MWLEPLPRVDVLYNHRWDSREVINLSGWPFVLQTSIEILGKGGRKSENAVNSHVKLSNYSESRR